MKVEKGNEEISIHIYNLACSSFGLQEERLRRVEITQRGVARAQQDPTRRSDHRLRPNYNSTVVLDYKLYLISSYGGYNTGNMLQEGTDAVFTLTQVVPGFSEGVQRMRLHDDFVLYIPYQLGYGAEPTGSEGYFGFIPPYSTLIYEVHLKAMQ